MHPEQRDNPGRKLRKRRIKKKRNQKRKRNIREEDTAMTTHLRKKTKDRKEDMIMIKLTRLIIINMTRKEQLIKVGTKGMILNDILKRILNVRGMTPHQRTSLQVEKKDIPEEGMMNQMKTRQGHLARNIEVEQMKNTNKEDKGMTQNKCIFIMSSNFFN